jgi:hypothetical protein
MVKEIDTNNIRKITFGIMNKYIDVTEMILQKLNSGQTIHLTINIFPSDPYVGKIKRLIIYYESGFNMIINENDIIVKKHMHSIIVKKNVNINIPVGLNYIISTNARDEPNIVEWIMYHLMIGFDYVVIIDHKSQIAIQKIVDNYEWRNKVYVIRREDEGAVKMMFLNDIIIPFMMKRCKKYFIHLDADEYFYLNKKYTLTSFTDMIKGDIIAINWLMFGCNNVEKNTNKYKCLIPIYKKSANKLNKHFKLLIRIDNANPFKFNNPHTIEYTTRKKAIYLNVLGQVIKGTNVWELMKSTINSSLEDTPSYINHYYVQSKEDYIRRKINRERDDIFAKRTFDEKIFNMDNDIDNNNILEYGNEIIKKLDLYENNKISLMNNDLFGFIMIRYVKCEQTNKSWIRCYESIRKFYNAPIIIIDDNSKMEYVTNHPTINCKIISGEFPRRGELLPYYYYIKYNFFKRAIILHDSMEIKKYYDFKNIPNYKNFTRLFHFGSGSYCIDIDHFNEMCKYVINGNNILQYHNVNKYNLVGCFGVCYIIDYDFLIDINKKYNIINLVNFIDTRKKRQCLERFLSCLFEYEKGKKFITRVDLFGSIFSNKGEYIQKYFFGR